MSPQRRALLCQRQQQQRQPQQQPSLPTVSLTRDRWHSQRPHWLGRDGARSAGPHVNEARRSINECQSSNMQDSERLQSRRLDAEVEFRARSAIYLDSQPCVSDQNPSPLLAPRARQVVKTSNFERELARRAQSCCQAKNSSRSMISATLCWSRRDADPAMLDSTRVMTQSITAARAISE